MSASGTGVPASTPSFEHGTFVDAPETPGQMMSSPVPSQGAAVPGATQPARDAYDPSKYAPQANPPSSGQPGSYGAAAYTNNPASNPGVPHSNEPFGTHGSQPNALRSDLQANRAPPPNNLTRGNVPITREELEKGVYGHEAIRGGMGYPQAQGFQVVDDGKGHSNDAGADRDIEKEASEQTLTAGNNEMGEKAGANSDAPASGPQPDENGHILVHWDGKDDREHVMNFPFWYRCYLTLMGGLMTLATAFASSAPSFLVPNIMEELNTNELTAKASTFLFVGGFCFAPLIWAPLSEIIGRKPTFVAAMIGFTAFNLGCAFTPNIGGLIIFRLLAGSFGSCTLSNVAPMIASLFSFKYLTVGIVVFALAPMSGPCIGPIIGGYIAEAGANWRWIFRVSAMVSFFFILISLFTIPETLDAVRLKMKAQRLRKETGDNRYVAPKEVHKLNAWEFTKTVLGKPVKLFCMEPMLIATTLYISFVYGTLYLLFDAYPVVFMELHHLKPGTTGLTFLGYFVGSCFGAAWAILFDNRYYLKKLDENGGKPPPPETRLTMAVAGAPLLIISLFWFAWTSFEHVSLWSPLVAGGVFGAALYLIFLGLMVYITEVYLFSAASAIAANTVVRSMFGVGFPMFGSQMYHNLNPRWASTVLAFIAVAMFPIPFVLIRYGKKLRSMSRYAHSNDN